MDLKKQRIEMAVTGLMLGLASYLQYIAYHTKERTKVPLIRSGNKAGKRMKRLRDSVRSS